MLEKFIHAGVTRKCNSTELLVGEPTRVPWGSSELASPPEISSASSAKKDLRLGWSLLLDDLSALNLH